MRVEGDSGLAAGERDAALREALGEGLPEDIRESVRSLLLTNVLTCGVYGALWTWRRQQALDALLPPLPLTKPLALAAVAAPYLGGLVQRSDTAAGAIVGATLYAASLTYNYRFWRVLRWRAERLGLPLKMSAFDWGLWLCFGQLLLQSKLNQLARAEHHLRSALDARWATEQAEREARGGEGSPYRARPPGFVSRRPDEVAPPARLKNTPFWALIDLVDKDALALGEDVEAVAPLRAALASSPLALRQAFHETLAYKLHAFDGPLFADEAGPPTGTEDRALLARTFVVASGQAHYREVLGTPAEMPKDPHQQCGALLQVAANATLDAGEDPFDHVPSLPFATGQNPAFWGTPAASSSTSNRSVDDRPEHAEAAAKALS
jgi:hypothetical protein